MLYDTHVFLGPSLDKANAQHYLWQATYHPPIQCGDMIRLLRCAPQKIVIIDGLYEQVPAVWHKEIMLALDKGIEVYGAASMGALRAAELHQYGMIGIGKIFQAFATHQLTDDDEVAVLHQDIQQDLVPINDAMVNIRETLAQAVCEHLIDRATHDALIHWCKSQFYPKRSLRKAIGHVGTMHPEQCTRLGAWLDVHGIIDLKRQDAIEVLTLVQQRLNKSEPLSTSKKFAMPYTKFIATMVDDVVATPFPLAQPGLPAIEQKLTTLEQEQPKEYAQVMELARLLQYGISVVDPAQFLDHHHYVDYITEHQLYYPKELYTFLKQHHYLAPLSTWLLHYICLSNTSEQDINRYLPAALFYFNNELPDHFNAISPLWSWIVLLIVLLHHQLDDPRLMIKKTVLNEHLREIYFWRRYEQQEKKSTAMNRPNPLADTKGVLHFVVTYMKVIYIHQGTKDFKLGLASTPTYYQWVYDAMALHDAVVMKETAGCET